MKTTFECGIDAEEQACQYLTNKGYQLIKSRYRTPYGEIDLLMYDNETLVAIEVKYRKFETDSLECLTQKQQKRIEDALMYYISENNLNESGKDSSLLRFDVVLLSQKKPIIHIENAW